jgi:peptide deformylase
MEIVSIDEIPIAEKISLDEPLDIFKICLKMQHICEEENGLGISAVQVGLPMQIFLILHSDGFRYYANCEYSPEGDNKVFKTLEGCLSLPGRFFEIENHRWEKIKVSGYRLVIKDSEPVFEKFEEVFDSTGTMANSIVFQHEIDHQLGQDGLINKIPASREVILKLMKAKE